MDNQTKIALNSKISTRKQQKINRSNAKTLASGIQTEAGISVLSPLAYLADLLTYAFDHIKKNDQCHQLV